MPSKYKKLIGKLPAFQQEFSFQQKVDAYKRKVGENNEDANISFLARHYELKRAAKEQLEEKISELNVQIEALDQMIQVKMDADEQESVRLASGALVYRSYEVYPSVEDKEKFDAWVVKKDLTGSLTFPWMTLKGICGEATLNGEALPAGVKVFLKCSIRVRNGG